MIRFEDVSVTYEGAAGPAVRGVDLEVPEGELALLVGPSGTGKSTVLNAVSGLVPHFTGGTLRGRVTVAGRDTRTHRPRELADVVGTVGQDPLAHFVTDTVEDELAYGMESLGIAPAVMRRRVEETLDLLGLAELRDRPIATLSGGQRQRVAIGSVLTPHPRVLVLDEPTSALDPAAAEEVLAVLQRLVHDLGTTVFMAEHRLERVVQYADRVVLLAEAGAAPVTGTPAEVMAVSPVCPPVVELGRLAEWAPLPLTVRDARRRATPLRERLADRSLGRPDGRTPAQRGDRIPRQPERTPKQPAPQAPRHTTAQGPGLTTEQTAGHTTAQGPRHTTAQGPGLTTEQTPGHTTEQTPGLTTEQTTGHTTEQTPGLTTEQTPGHTTGRDPVQPSVYPLGRPTGRSPENPFEQAPVHPGGPPRKQSGATPAGFAVRVLKRLGGRVPEGLGAGSPEQGAAVGAAAEVRGLAVRRGRVDALRWVDLDVAPGETLALMGRNGAGKSTLLSALVGLVAPDSGSVLVGGAVPHRTRPRDLVRLVGLVPQEPRDLLYADTVGAECAAADQDAGAAPGTCRELVSGLLPGVADGTHPRDLSEGQRLALALAVVLTARPPLLLLDEPTRGLDYAAKARLVGVLRALATDGHAIVLATHDVELAAELAQRVVLIAEGEVIADGPTEEIVVSSPSFAPQVTKILAPQRWLTVAQVRAALAEAPA
ncbi:ATP-binding cassette domain-containing protein [Streptomyces sp. NPDC006655]|uniref:ATP-binding cassette domain-containing protein n=1 Tax=Streptomyces sp. NPDC006655 TaxID=3156898 RepID=UPI003452095D